MSEGGNEPVYIRRCVREKVERRELSITFFLPDPSYITVQSFRGGFRGGWDLRFLTAPGHYTFVFAV